MPRHHMGDARKGVMVTSAMAMTAVLANAGVASAAVPTAESTSERVLQSVNVTMGPDGTTTAVDSSVVRTDGTAEDAEASDDAFSPADVVGDLPVRVLTSWRTSEGAGTDLSDLQGYTGRVAIDLTIQNLTVKPQILTYDAAGTSRQQAALVGSPLTVVASTALGDVKADRLVSDDKGTGVNVTNGVIGKGADGTTVQWAALLAPPTLSATSEFSLVLDAKDFDVPSFDLSVQPGLVTDPSMGALVDAAFNPASSEELDLQRRTIELIGEVNGVLARASDTISDVRTSLTSSAETLGTQTVADLRSSTQSVTTNMGSLGSALQGLQGDLNSTLESTGSSAVAELEQAVATVDGLLGDTSAQPPTARVSGNGCETTVARPGQAGSVFTNLLQVTSQLDGYARATTECKGALQASIMRTIGPDLTDAELTDDEKAELCERAEGGAPRSVTCSLLATQLTFETAAEQLRLELLGGEVDGETVPGVLDLIKPTLYGDAASAGQGLIDLITKDAGIDATTLAIRERRELIVTAMKTTYAEALEIRSGLATIEAALGSLRPKALAVRDQLDDISEQSATAAGEVCSLVRSGTLTFEEARSTLALLVAEADPSCTQGPPQRLDEDADGNPISPQPITTRLAGQVGELTQGLSDSEDAQEVVDSAQADVEEAIAVLEETQATEPDNGPYDPEDTDLTDDNLSQLFRRLVGLDGESGLLAELRAKSAELDAAIFDIDELADDVVEIESEINEAIDQAKGNVGGGVVTGTEDVLEAGGNASAELGTMFERSAAGLRAAGDDVVRNGKKSVNQQKFSFFTAQEQAANRVTQTVKDGLGQINSGVNASTRDMEAATTLLVADLRKVLLDLGQREIGGAGLLGSMATNAATARQADYQLALAGSTASAYANVRDRDIAGLMLRQEQTDAAMDSLTRLPAFQLELPSGSQHRTVYSFSIEDN